MSEKKVLQLQNELEELNKKMKCLCAELDASKSMFNDEIQRSYSLRSNLIMLQQAYEEAVAQNNELNKNIVALNQEVFKLSTPQFDEVNKVECNL